MICCEPPRAQGQSIAWATAASTSPNDAVPARSSGITECAAQPAKRARAASVLKCERTRCSQERSANNPKRAVVKRCRGLGCQTGPRRERMKSSSAKGRKRLAQARASAPRCCAVVSIER